MCRAVSGSVTDPPLLASHYTTATGPSCAATKTGENPPSSGWVTDPPLPASHCTNAMWPFSAAACCGGGPAVVRLGDRRAVTGQPLHHRDVPSLRCDEERGKYVGGALGDPPLPATLHHREIAILCRSMEWGVPVIVWLGDRRALSSCLPAWCPASPGPALHGHSAGTGFLEYIDARREPAG